MTPVVWGPVSWLVDPPDQETVDRLIAEHAHQLGFADVSAYWDAVQAGNLASEGDDMAALAMRYIRRDIARVAQSRAAAGSVRRGKWDAVRGEALDIAARIMARRSNLSESAVADLVLARLSEEHGDLPDKRTVIRWMKKV
ncbi:hypothetical protein [Shimia aestuarii]|uniref:Uncharacterized protein n=1 Tax=Shimia aestuarii TaxID=254406 RepID=A0A1I4N6W6_9RHOB|nr:hypothetical protein [Shimia aestuarii]SFM11304.1 hypothetical protein SAMN04488042_10420 [Shimia aestuarii]